MSKAPQLMHMKRCRSFAEIEDDISADSSVSSKKGNGQSRPRLRQPKLYYGRRSLGFATTTKVKRKKSKTERDRDYDYGQYADRDSDIDEGYTESSPTSTYRCIPAVAASTNSSDASLLSMSAVSSASHITSPECPQSPTRHLALLSLSSVDDRNSLHADLTKFLKNAEKQKDQVQMAQKNFKCERNGQAIRFVVTGKSKDNKRYNFGDVLWIVIKAYFSGRDVIDKETWTVEDLKISEERHKRELVLDRIKEFKFESVTKPHRREEEPDKPGVRRVAHQSLARRTVICKDYCKNLRSAREKVESLLNEFDLFAALFQHQKALWDSVELARGQEERKLLEERVTSLRAWINTLDDLNEKIEILGEVFETSSMPNKGKNWLRPLADENPIRSLEDVQPVFEEYVTRSLNLKGMKRVLERIERLIETTLVKASILLQRPPMTYAAATVAMKNSLQLTPIMKERYGEMSAVRFSNPVPMAMQLPFLGPLYFFLLGIPMQLVVQWLSIRSKTDPPTGCEMDELTFDAMIEDSRDCVQEAVRIKRNYVTMLQSMCPLCALPGYLYPLQFNQYVLDVFQKYVHYVRCWANCDSVMRDDPAKLFLRIEKEWGTALGCARFIRSAMESLCNTMCDVTGTMIEKMIDDFADEQMCEIKSQWFAEEEDNSNEEDEGTGTINTFKSRDSHHELSTFMSSVNRLIRDIKEREIRIFSFLRQAVSDLHDAVGYRLKNDVTIAEFLSKMKEDHCLIDLESGSDGSGEAKLAHLGVTLFVDKSAADKAIVEECLLAIAEGRRIEGDCHIVVLPYADEYIRQMWTGRTVRVVIDEEKYICYGYLRRNMICVMGNYDLVCKYSSCVEIAAPSCSSNQTIDDRLSDLLKDNLLPHLNFMHNTIDMIQQKIMSATQRPQSWSALRRPDTKTLWVTLDVHFLIGFQVHRDLARIISDSYLDLYGQQVVEQSVSLIEKWHKFVISKSVQPTPILPVWSCPAFTFMQFLSEPKWTNPSVMTAEQYEMFSSYVSNCKKMLVVQQQGELQTLLKEHRPKVRGSRSSSSKPTSPVDEGPLSREDRLKLAAEKVDELIEKKKHENLQLGRIVYQKDDKFRLGLSSTRVDINYKKAPFEWLQMEQIASGTFGTVYRVFDVKRHRVLAAKKIKVQREAVKAIEIEINIFRTLQHPNLVKYYGVEVNKDEVVIFMEFCSEGTLERICREGMDLKLVRRYTNSLLKAVQYIHSIKIVHRDIKPANIFLDPHCVLKLGDFGCSGRLIDTSTIYGEFQDFVGTPQYMAPEVFSSGGGQRNEEGKYRGYGRMVDIWSVGCVVIQMLSGRVPWDRKDKFMIAWEICEHKHKPTYPLIASQRNDVSTFLDMCFEFDPAQRACADKLLQSTFANVNVQDGFEENTDSVNDTYEII